MKSIFLLSSALVVAFSAPNTLAGEQVGTITNIKNSVQLYTHPSTTGIEGPPPHAKFEGMYYSVSEAKVGMRLEKGNIVRTLPGSKACVIFENGDQYYVAPATSFKVTWDRDTPKGKAEVELRYGKSRFVVSKKGPRSRLLIRTKSVVMGVRGTDFFVAVNAATGATETATLRGSVEVTPVQSPQSAASAPPKAELVKSGQTASSQGSEPIRIRKTTQEELKAVTRNSEIQPRPSGEIPKELETEVNTLEARASQTTIEDIRAENPDLASKLEKQQVQAATINATVVAELSKDAPESQSDQISGPIADTSLEKGEVAPITESPEAASQLPQHRFWGGLRVGGGSGKLKFDGGAPLKTGGFASSAGGTDAEQVGLVGEYEFNSSLALFGEMYPKLNHGTQGQFGTTGTCSGGGCDKIKMESTRLIALLKYKFSILGSRRFGGLVGGGTGLNFLGRATFPNNASMDITQGFTKVTPLFNLSAGLSYRLFDRFKVLLEMEMNEGITNIAIPDQFFTGNTVVKTSDGWLGLSLLYGF